MLKELLKKVDDKQAVIGVVGLGYVGLPLLLCFVEKGFHAIGLDIDTTKCESLLKGRPYIKHIPLGRIREAAESGLLQATSDFSWAAKCDAILIAVPTPLNKN